MRERNFEVKVEVTLQVDVEVIDAEVEFKDSAFVKAREYDAVLSVKSALEFAELNGFEHTYSNFSTGVRGVEAIAIEEINGE
jgi:hypothetical protein